MEQKGTVKVILPTETGVSKQGKDWKKSGIVITFQDGSYEKDLAFSVMGDKITQIETIRTGQQVTVSFNLSSREYNGKYYTDAQLWKVTTETVAEPSVGNADDLPF